MTKKPKPLIGGADLAIRLERGEDPNADLASVKPDTKGEGALLLSLAGASWSEIARQQGYSSATHARLAVERILAEAVGPEQREQKRLLQDRRYNRLLQSVMSKAVDPRDPNHLAYNARALAIIDRIGMLHGLNQPQQFQITPTDERMREYLQAMLPKAQEDREAEEANIFDAEILDDEQG